MSMLARLELTFLGLGVLGFALGVWTSRPVMLQAGLFFVAVSLLLSGLDALVMRRLGFWHGAKTDSVPYAGQIARFWGVVYILVAVWLFAAVISTFLGRQTAVVTLLLRRPGILLISLGLVFLSMAGANLFEMAEPPESEQSAVSRVLQLVFSSALPGVILLILGIGMLGLGLLELVLPATFDSLGGSLLELIVQGPPG